ncbi:MAG: iron complex outermembrane receptor protein [Halioglobus sp.]|jgi:iron complex outermembrane receptor protein
MWGITMFVGRFRRRRLFNATLAALATVGMSSGSAFAQNANAQNQSDTEIEEVHVTAQKKVFSNNVITASMQQQQSPITSVNALIDNLPGVSIQEGDTYGFDDWSTTIAIRGFQNSLDEQQVGTTIDGIPNGNSNYGGGAKANRYIDPSNVGGVVVSQGTADITSRSLEALGGTIDFQTDNPTEESRIRAQYAVGEFDAQRYYIRVDTGTFGGNTKAWFSASHQEASDWINGAAENERDHFAAKLISSFDRLELTAYAAYDDTQEDNYQRLFSPEEFNSNPQWDRLTDNWSGVPYIDQVYRKGWSTLRENFLAYVKVNFSMTDNLNFDGSVYYHDNEGRGDWVPPYLANVVDDKGGPESEVTGAGNVQGGPFLGQIFFVDGQGVALSPTAGCVSSITFPYGGAGPEYDPTCYPVGAIGVQSYRTTNYTKERTGATLDGDWVINLGGVGNQLRGGVWYEDQTRDESRTWQKITDTRVGFEFENKPYWTQYDRSYPQETFKWYVEDQVDIAGVSITAGFKQFLVDVSRVDRFGETTDVEINSDSDVLFSGGLLWETPIDGIELFAGYAENFKAISDNVLERPDSDLDSLEPETAENTEIGLRYRGDQLFLSATYYDTEFSNRIIFLSPESSAGPNYIIGTSGTYFNAGGIDSSGIELTADVKLTDNLSLYGAYSYSDSTYAGTGDKDVDAGLGVTAGNKVTGIPEDQLVLSLDWSRGNLLAGISAKYTGERQIRRDNTWAADEYITADAYVTVTGEEALGSVSGWSISLLVNNLTDESYLGGISGEGAWIGAPRTVSAAFTVDI